VIHSPRHVRTLAELTDDEVAATAEAWQERFAAAAAEGFPYVHALVNEGRAAGSSLAHTHSQLVWMREPPPAAGDERGRDEAIGELLARSELAVSHAGGVAAVVHPAGRLPYETLIAAANGAFDLGDALLVLRDVVRRLRAIEGPLPWNAWLHHDATAAHLELVPRLSVLAGVELGAGIYVNTVDPLDAAAALREAAV
jgi:UDPglucose--hexose-1-phosphate uridylyltransferase